ncbi:exodeoxyribonuclease 7 large subunit [Clostridium sp. CAG:1013]|nr:exodeoxyribonuclease 7 large subunit [Clostridium sp. CAG:1013]
MRNTILTVSQVNFFIKSLIEGDGRLQSVLISGEISNFTDHYRSGHLYFSLKDDKSVLKAVMFSSAARRLKFRPRDGMKVLIRGRISVYEPSGQYQLYAEDMQPEGVGALSLAFEQLKERLAEEGLFLQEHKRPIPAYPERIGVITSPTGAAVRDILQITARRWPLAKIVLAPVLVQGEQAPGQIVEALREMDRQKACDVIILGRGGGSLEDLWAFNDESVARAVFGCSIPVVSAVGHETDFTICDFVADLRAPTPSAAAELCTPDWREQLSQVTTYQRYFREEGPKLIEYLRQSLDLLVQDSPLASPQEFLLKRREKVNDLAVGLENGLQRRLEREQKRLAVLSGTLDALSPLKVLSRGYAVVMGEQGVVRKASEVDPGQRVSIRLAEGSLSAQILDKGE